MSVGNRVDFQCRYWFPRHDRQFRYKFGQLPDHDDWKWHRYYTTLYFDLPPNSRQQILLPAPFFTMSAASLQVLYFEIDHAGRTNVHLELDNRRVTGPEKWRVSEQWTQITFDNPNTDAYPHRGPWWLRYRTPYANDLMSRIMKTFDNIHMSNDIDAIHEEVEQVRREVIMHSLGGAFK